MLGIRRRLNTAHRLVVSRHALKHRIVSYSQEGEDLILENLFFGKQSGFFIDVGAHHPHRFSNTFLFYEKGWRGLNIDATPGSMVAFRKHRGRDINIEAAVSANRGRMLFHQYAEPALNTFSTEVAEDRMGNPRAVRLGALELMTEPLAEILKRHLPPGQQVEFMNIDVEGMDFECLVSNDWDRFRPLVVLVEQLADQSIPEVLHSDVNRFMNESGYRLCARTVRTLFFFSDLFQTGDGKVPLAK